MSQSSDDVVEIVQTKYRYVQAIDARNWDLYRSTLDDEVLVDFAGLGFRGGPRMRTADSWVRGVSQQMAGLHMTQHLLQTPLVSTDGDRAQLTAYLVAHHLGLSTDTGEDLFTIGARYDDVLVRVSDGWRLSAMTLTTLWTSGNGNVMAEARDRATKHAAGGAG